MPLARLAALALAVLPSLGPDDPAWTGVWVDPADPGFAFLFEEGRCGWLYDGKPSFHRTKPDGAGALRLETWGHVQRMELTVEEDRLTAAFRDQSRQLVRAEEVPFALRVEPYELPEPMELAPEHVAALQEELAWRREEDQRVRSGAGAGGFDAEAMAEMQRVDAENTARLLTVLAEVGWIDADRFGAEAANAAFLMVQHTADLRLMRTALPHIRADVEAGRLDGQPFALLWDRLQLNLGYRQRYGSQLCGLPGGGNALMPLEDPGRVDELRAEMGMGPLADYLAYFEQDGEPIPMLDQVLDH